jgi:cytoskeleton protein RodZ
MSDLEAETAAETVSAITLGQRLAEAREARGLSLDELAMRLKFSVRQLQALEANAYNVLPEPTIVRGMVRGYAKAVGLDAAPLVAELERQLVADPFTVVVPVMHVQIRDNSKRNNRIYLLLSLVLLVVCAVLVGEWYWRKHVSPLPFKQPQSVAPAQISAPLASTVPPSPTAQPIEEGSAQTFIPAPSDEGGDAQGAASATAVAGTSPAPAAASTANPAGAAAPSGKRIQLHFDDNSWVEVKDAGGNVLMAQLNTANTDATLQGQPPFRVVVGNADKVSLQYEGNSVALGPYIENGVARLTLE